MKRKRIRIILLALWCLFCGAVGFAIVRGLHAVGIL
jgi:hypothetical protein